MRAIGSYKLSFFIIRGLHLLRLLYKFDLHFLMKKERLIISSIVTPLGSLLLASFENELVLCRWADDTNNDRIIKRISLYLDSEPEFRENTRFNLLEKVIDMYLNKHIGLPEFPYRLVGTPFQCEVWQALTQIPFGATRKYLDIAKAIGREKSVRAVASAIASNPLELFIPCHRVVPSSGGIGNYTGGAWRKKYLLSLEATSKPLFAYQNKKS